MDLFMSALYTCARPDCVIRGEFLSGNDSGLSRLRLDSVSLSGPVLGAVHVMNIRQ